MRKSKEYYFDKNSLTYKPVIKTFREKVKRTAVYMMTIFGFALAIYGVLVVKDYSPKQIFLQNSRQKICQRIYSAGERFTEINNVLSNIESDDDSVLRVFAELKPLPKEIREAGFGGIDRYKKFSGMENSSQIIEVFKNADQIKQKINIQEKSFDDIQKLVNYKTKYFASVPGIRPMYKRAVSRVSSPFGKRFHPIFHRYIFHSGIDLAARIGTEIFATGAGVVQEATVVHGYGNMIKINHHFGYQTIYGHLSRILVHKGDVIHRGQLIAYSGNTGNSTGPHLHYEIRKDNKPVNPVKYYLNDISDKEYHAMVSAR